MAEKTFNAGTMTVTEVPCGVRIDVHVRISRWCRVRVAIGLGLMKLGARIARTFRLIVTKDTDDGPLGERFDETMDRLAAEITRACGKFPDNRLLVDALAEELGEAAREDLPCVPGNREWLQVACVAMRLYMEGTPDNNTQIMRLFLEVARLGRARLEKEGHS